MTRRDADKAEAAVAACYSTWAASYYRNYYESGSAYPPVHQEIVRRVLDEAGAASVLDAGCGPASMLRALAAPGRDLYGFDLTAEMVREAQRVMSSLAVPADRLWQGSVIDPQAFRPPGAGATAFDAVICIGVLPHVAETDDDVVIRNLQQAVMPGGLVIVEGRNQLFSLFTLNRYSHEFFLRELIRAEDLRDALPDDAPALDRALETLRERFRVDLPPRRMGVAGEPGYDEVLSRTHNPLVLREKFVASGMRDVRVLFYHYHCLPPMLEAALPDLFRRQSLAMEDPVDWRGYFMASAFLLVGRR